MTDDELSDADVSKNVSELSHSERLFAAFQRRHIRLRLHGTKLPSNYTISLRLPSGNDRSAQPRQPERKRRRLDPSKAGTNVEMQTDSDSDNLNSSANTGKSGTTETVEEDDDTALASEPETEDSVIRANNAYTGATNSIGSVHQRHWFLTLDRRNSGFRKDAATGRWEGPCEPFFVRGRDVERSVLTGRNADEVMKDEGVEKFVGRKMWRAIVE